MILQIIGTYVNHYALIMSISVCLSTVYILYSFIMLHTVQTQFKSVHNLCKFTL